MGKPPRSAGRGRREASVEILRSARRPEQCREGGHMDVMAAGVHETVSGGEGRARLLLNGQGVELGPHRDGLPRGPDARQEARMDDGLHTPGPEGFRDETRGSVLLMAPLRDRM